MKRAELEGMIIESNCLTASGLTKIKSILLRVLSKRLFNTGQLRTLTTSLGSLFQGLITHWVKKCFLMSSLNLF